MVLSYKSYETNLCMVNSFFSNLSYSQRKGLSIEASCISYEGTMSHMSKLEFLKIIQFSDTDLSSLDIIRETVLHRKLYSV